MKRKTASIIKMLSVVLIISFLLYWTSFYKCMFVKYPSGQRELNRFERSRLYFTVLSDYIVCEDKLYVIYDRKSVLDCFDLDGNYLFSYAFKASSGDSPALYTDGRTVYLRDHFGNAFILSSEGNVEGFAKGQGYEISTGENILRDDKNKIAENGDRFELRWASIYKITADGEAKKIVSRPFWMVIYQNNYTLLVCFFLFPVVAILYEARKDR